MRAKYEVNTMEEALNECLAHTLKKMLQRKPNKKKQDKYEQWTCFLQSIYTLTVTSKK